MKKLLLLLIAIQCSMFNVQWSMACTNFIVGKQASADGSVFVTYNADSYGAFMPLYHYPAAKHQPGEYTGVQQQLHDREHDSIPERSGKLALLEKFFKVRQTDPDRIAHDFPGIEGISDAEHGSIMENSHKNQHRDEHKVKSPVFLHPLA